MLNADSNSGVGSWWGPLQHIKLGPGVVGRTAPVAVALLLVLGMAIFAVRHDPWMVVGLAVCAVAAAALFIWKAFNYAESHPNHSVLDGAELVRYAEVEQAAKLPPPTLDLTAEPTSNPSPTQIGTGHD